MRVCIVCVVFENQGKRPTMTPQQRKKVTICICACACVCACVYVSCLSISLCVSVVPVLSTGTKIISVPAPFIPVSFLELQLELQQ